MTRFEALIIWVQIAPLYHLEDLTPLLPWELGWMHYLYLCPFAAIFVWSFAEVNTSRTYHAQGAGTMAHFTLTQKTQKLPFFLIRISKQKRVCTISVSICICYIYKHNYGPPHSSADDLTEPRSMAISVRRFGTKMTISARQMHVKKSLGTARLLCKSMSRQLASLAIVVLFLDQAWWWLNHIDQVCYF